jgi:hypothetical protein
VDGCKKTPFYRKIEDGTVLCKEHGTLEGSTYVYKRCVTEGCDKKATWGALFESPTHCKTHKKPGAINRLKQHPKCSEVGCKEPPTFSDRSDLYPVRCFQHAKPSDIQIESLTCFSCKLPAIVDSKTHLCAECGAFENLGGTPESRKKHQEDRVAALFASSGLVPSQRDCQVPDGCTRHRPDFVFDAVCGAHVVIVEVDEHQHARVSGPDSAYSCDCEMVRMANIHQSYGGLGVVFVRYNPDSFLDGSGIRRKQMATDGERLVSIVRQLLSAPPVSGLKLCYLYYDGFTGDPTLYDYDYVGKTIRPWNPSD